MKRKGLLSISIIGIIVFSTPFLTSAHEKVVINMLTSVSGSGVPEAYAQIAAIANKNHPWLRINSQETTGYSYNARAFTEEPFRYKDTMGSTSFFELSMMKKKVSPFKDGYKKWKPKVLAWESLIIFYAISPRPDVNTIYDLSGKRLITSLKGGSTAQTAIALTKVAGLFDSIKWEHLTFDKQVDAMSDGLGDAIWLFQFGESIRGRFSEPLMVINAKASGRTYHSVDVPEEMIRQMQANEYMVVPYKWQKDFFGNPGPMALGAPCGIMVDESFPFELAYEIAKFLVENVEEIAQKATFLNYWTRESLVYMGPKEFLHPGALRAYKELGLFK